MPNFWRPQAAAHVASGVLFIPYLSKYKQLPFFFKYAAPMFASFGVLGMFMQVWRFTHQQFEFAEWLTFYFTTNIFTILFEIV